MSFTTLSYTLKREPRKPAGYLDEALADIARAERLVAARRRLDPQQDQEGGDRGRRDVLWPHGSCG